MGSQPIDLFAHAIISDLLFCTHDASDNHTDGEYYNCERLCCPGVIVTKVITTVAELFTSFPTNMILTLYMKHWLLAGTPTPHYLTL